MKDGYYKAIIHGWLEFFKVEGQVFGLETGKKNSWFPTIVTRTETWEATTIVEVRASYPEFVTKNQKASDEDIFGSVRSGFASKRMGPPELFFGKPTTFLSRLEKLLGEFNDFEQAEIDKDFGKLDDGLQILLANKIADLSDTVANACTADIEETEQ